MLISNHGPGVLLSALLLTGGCSLAAEGNLALGKKVEASSFESERLKPENAVDGKRNTRWSARFNDPQSFQVDLGSPQKVNRIVITWGSSAARDVEFLHSVDASSWKAIPVDMEKRKFRPDGQGTDLLEFPAETIRYFRINAKSRVTRSGCSIVELEIYAPSAAPENGKK